MTHLAAYTPPGGEYPPFVSLSEVAEGVRIDVRARSEDPGMPGWCTTLTVERSVAVHLLEEALSKLRAGG